MRKANSLAVSEIVFKMYEMNFGYILEENHLSAYLDTFNNCRETGYYMTVNDDYGKEKNEYIKPIYIWAFESRNSDSIVIIYSENYPTNGMFDEEAYKNRQYFEYNKHYEASIYITNLIEDHFEVNVK